MTSLRYYREYISVWLQKPQTPSEEKAAVRSTSLEAMSSKAKSLFKYLSNHQFHSIRGDSGSGGWPSGRASLLRWKDWIAKMVPFTVPLVGDKGRGWTIRPVSLLPHAKLRSNKSLFLWTKLCNHLLPLGRSSENSELLWAASSGSAAVWINTKMHAADAKYSQKSFHRYDLVYSCQLNPIRFEVFLYEI